MEDALAGIRHSRSKIKPAPKISKAICGGVGLIATEYIKSVQPDHVTEQEYQSDFDRMRIGLAILNDICNMDKHRRLAIAVTQWTGEFPKSVVRVPYHPMRTRDENATVDHVGLEVWPGTPILPEPPYFERRIKMSY